MIKSLKGVSTALGRGVSKGISGKGTASLRKVRDVFRDVRDVRSKFVVAREVRNPRLGGGFSDTLRGVVRGVVELSPVRDASLLSGDSTGNGVSAGGSGVLTLLSVRASGQ